MTGKSHCELRIASPIADFSHHVKNGSKDISFYLVRREDAETQRISFKEKTLCPCASAPLDQGWIAQDHSGGMASQPARTFTTAGCGCLSQSNQLYAIMRPATTMLAQSTSDTAPAIRALFGRTGSRSHAATRRKTPE